MRRRLWGMPLGLWWTAWALFICGWVGARGIPAAAGYALVFGVPLAVKTWGQRPEPEPLPQADLADTARLEHSLGLAPHTDPDVLAACQQCRRPPIALTGPGMTWEPMRGAQIGGRGIHVYDSEADVLRERIEANVAQCVDLARDAEVFAWAQDKVGRLLDENESLTRRIEALEAKERWLAERAGEEQR